MNMFGVPKYTVNTPRTRDRGEPELEAVPQLDLRACRNGGEEGDDDERQRGAKQWWSESNAGDEVPCHTRI
jgi:hypothetical protein